MSFFMKAYASGALKQFVCALSRMSACNQGKSNRRLVSNFSLSNFLALMLCFAGHAYPEQLAQSNAAVIADSLPAELLGRKLPVPSAESIAADGIALPAPNGEALPRFSDQTKKPASQVSPSEKEQVPRAAASLVDSATPADEKTILRPDSSLKQAILPLPRTNLPAAASPVGNRPNVLTARSGKEDLHGDLRLAILSLPSYADSQAFSHGELELLSEFMSRHSKLRVTHSGRTFSTHGPWQNFGQWLRQAHARGRSSPRPIAAGWPEDDALELLARSAAFIPYREYEEFFRNVKETLTSYFQIAFQVKFFPDKPGWASQLTGSPGGIPGWQRSYLDSAEASYRLLLQARKPDGKELRNVFQFFRISSLMRYPVLFCQITGRPGTIDDQNVALLRSYVRNGGAIYFTNTSTLEACRAVRSLITDIIEEQLSGKDEKKLLERVRRNDRFVTGYRIERPVPQVFHPWTDFPFSMPAKSVVTISIFDFGGKIVFADTVKYVSSGRELELYRWHAVDNQGNGLPGGYYLYQAEAGLCRQTHPLRISELRLLSRTAHPVFRSVFPLSDVPTGAQVSSIELPYSEPGVYGVTIGNRLAICYAEGYGEMALLESESRRDDRETALRWMMNAAVTLLDTKSRDAAD